jgi:hypothetical protein
MKANRAYKKGEAFRDARLFVIACEGKETEPAYFQHFESISRRVKVKIVQPKEGEAWNSSPKWVLDRAAQYVSDIGLSEDDQLWLVMDLDRWELKTLHEIGQVCSEQPGWNLAISNPCFEVWLVMHLSDTLDFTETACQAWKTKLKGLAPDGYSPRKLLPLLQNAIARAEAVDKNPEHFMPESGTTKVYRLAKEILPFLDSSPR